METPSITQIRIGGHPVGIIGLKETLQEIASSLQGSADENIREALVKEISGRNYVPDSAREAYRTALFREYRKFIGMPVPEEPAPGLQIKILGPGCPNCEGLERSVMAVLAELQIPADLEHVRNPLEISEYGVMGTPALVINGKVKSVGKIPSKESLKKMLTHPD